MNPTLPLLLEVGCEEIPARFLADSERQLGDRLVAALRDAGLLEALPAHAVQTFSTPRRLVAYLPEVRAGQPDTVERIVGPAVKVAFDGSGMPTRAAESFASKQGAKVEDLLQIETPKGLYLAVERTTHGRPAMEVLSGLIPEVITSISFPRSMSWECTGVRFARPIRWILALYGEAESAGVIPFELAGVESGNFTFGHRLKGSAPITVMSFDGYSAKLRESLVELDGERRRSRVREAIARLLDKSSAEHGHGDGLRVVPDAWLEDWTAASTEWPTAIVGSFDTRYQAIPREILTTVMRDHQKYFAVEDAKGVLQPYFLAILNVDEDVQGWIRQGHERVLTARFRDALFFLDADSKTTLEERRASLSRVTYHDSLGSYADKVSRMLLLAETVCAELEGQGRLNPDQKAHARRSVELCKCDLTTQMVQEFTELQGAVGGLYAKAQGEPEEVWQAIYDHYQPVNLEDKCPHSVVGAVVSLADKLDAVVAGFSAGLEPTGSSDPFGLRRAGNGTVKLAIEALPGLDLYRVSSRAVELSLSARSVSADTALSSLVDQFLRERLEFYLQDAVGLRYDTVRAVLSRHTVLEWHVPSKVLARARALEQVRDTEDFQALAAAAKRTRNILSKSAKPEDFGESSGVDEKLFSQEEERDLYRAYHAARRTLGDLEVRSDYASAFRKLASLRPSVDRFFDKVLVMDPDPAVRANRLALLADLNTLAFLRFADLSEIEAGVSSGNGA
jgi:glycyl-tRNA synthetase beta chain